MCKQRHLEVVVFVGTYYWSYPVEPMFCSVHTLLITATPRQD